MKSSGHRKRLVIMRHEMTQENKVGLIQGQSVGGTLASPEINPEKVKWCEKNILLPAVIVSSSLARCVQSANIISDVLDIPVLISPLFIQRSWGNVEGTLVKDLKKKYSKNAFLSDVDELAPGAEPLQVVIKRAQEAWGYLKNTDARTVVIITHDEFSNYLVNEMLTEGLFKRSLIFNQAHVLDFTNSTLKKVMLHANVYLEPIKHHVIIRSDNKPFMDNKIGLRVLRSHGIALVQEEDLGKLKDPSLIEGMIVGDGLVSVDDLVVQYPNLKIISKGGKGVDNIRLVDKELVKKGVVCITNTPGCNERSVAEFTAGLVANAVRKISEFNLQVKDKIWRHELTPDYSEVTVGVMGLGIIGQKVVRILKDLGFSIVAWTVHPEKHKDFIKENKIRMVTVDELCLIANVVTLHLRLSKETENILGQKQLKAMKAHNSYLINCSRAGLIDYKEIKSALDKNWISGAALDVWPEEPIKSKWLRKLATHLKVMATPHIAGGTYSAISKSIALIAYNMAWYLCGVPGIVTAVPLEELE